MGCTHAGADKTFWSHEWTKHGTCAAPALNSEHAYFGKALDLRRSTDLLGALTAAGLAPGSDPLSTYDVQAALSKGVGQDVVLHCGGSGDASPRKTLGSHGISYLEEVWACYNDTPDMTVMKCPSNVKNTCGTQLLIPAAPATAELLL